MWKLIFSSLLFALFLSFTEQSYAVSDGNLHIRSIDTMKYSRDKARQMLNDNTAVNTINKQVKNIADTGATHVAIGTPYDREFLPVLKLWVSAARKYGLRVWFRGNFSGWEGWFNYPQIDKLQHTKSTEKFIVDNPGLFEDGDLFTSCPECENGNNVSPNSDNVKDYRTFLINEYNITKKAFNKINKQVKANYYSMNGDVAKLVMDKDTTKALDNIVTVDHYVKTPQQLKKDIEEIALNSGGNVMLGEIGAPIPDIHGNMTEKEQSNWLADVFAKLAKIPELEGINYWVNQDGSTAIWDLNGNKREGVEVITNFYKDSQISGIVSDPLGRPVPHALIRTLNEEYRTDNNGRFNIPLYSFAQSVQISADGFRHKANIKLTRNRGQIIMVYSNDNNIANILFKPSLSQLFNSPIAELIKLLTNQ